MARFLQDITRLAHELNDPSMRRIERGSKIVMHIPRDVSVVLQVSSYISMHTTLYYNVTSECHFLTYTKDASG